MAVGGAIDWDGGGGVRIVSGAAPLDASTVAAGGATAEVARARRAAPAASARTAMAPSE